VKIYIGHDSRQPQNSIVCMNSIRRFGHDVTLIDRGEMQSIGYDREEDGSTEFTYTRFLTPLLNEYEGVALFCDSDFVWRKDPALVLQHLTDAPVTCVKHLIKQVRENRKFNEHKNVWYPKKWWSSMMVFNCGHEDCRNLTMETVNTESPQYLHRMEWASEIGRLDETYNYLVGYYDFYDDPVAVHFTDGTPQYQKYAQDDFAGEWHDLRRV
jgi:hypothetical protein